HCGRRWVLRSGVDGAISEILPATCDQRDPSHPLKEPSLDGCHAAATPIQTAPPPMDYHPRRPSPGWSRATPGENHVSFDTLVRGGPRPRRGIVVRARRLRDLDHDRAVRWVGAFAVAPP